MERVVYQVQEEMERELRLRDVVGVDRCFSGVPFDRHDSHFQLSNKPLSLTTPQTLHRYVPRLAIPA